MLAIVNNAAVNMRYRYLFKLVFSFPSDGYPEVGLLDHMAVPFFIVWGAPTLLSTVAAPHSQPRSTRALFTAPSPALVSRPQVRQVWVVSHCGLICPPR